jgi:hypothetical protein
MQSPASLLITIVQCSSKRKAFVSLQIGSVYFNDTSPIAVNKCVVDGLPFMVAEHGIYYLFLDGIKFFHFLINLYGAIASPKQSS